MSLLVNHSISDDLYRYFPLARAIQLHKKHALPFPQYELPLIDRDCFARSETEMLAMSMAIWTLVFTHISNPDRKIVMFVVSFRRCYLFQKSFHIVQEQRLAFIDPYCSCRVIGEDNGDSLFDPCLCQHFL